MASTVSDGFIAGALIGYAMKKVVKIAAVIVGLFFAGLAYLPYQQILNLNWNKLQTASQDTLSTLANATTQIPGLNTGPHTGAFSNFGIPLTGSMAMGFAIGFMRG